MPIACERCGLDRDDPKTHDMYTGECAATTDRGLAFMWLAETAHELYHSRRVPGTARCFVEAPDGTIYPLYYFDLKHTPDGPVVTFYAQPAWAAGAAPGLPYSLLDSVTIAEEPTPEQARHAGEVMAHLFELYRDAGATPNFGDKVKDE